MALSKFLAILSNGLLITSSITPLSYSSLMKLGMLFGALSNTRLRRLISSAMLSWLESEGDWMGRALGLILLTAVIAGVIFY